MYGLKKLLKGVHYILENSLRYIIWYNRQRNRYLIITLNGNLPNES